jgi:hypothetical protein
VAIVNYSFFLSTQWQIAVVCTDPATGLPLNLAGGSIELRIANSCGVLLDAALPGDNTGAANFLIEPEGQTGFESGFYAYEIRSLDSNSIALDQFTGTLSISNSLFVEFPYTPPGGELDFSDPDNSGLIGH